MSFQTHDKVSNDQFADIRNGALTPVTATIYNLASQEDKDFLNSCIDEKSFTEKEQARLVSILFETGTYSLISKKIKSASRQIKKEIKNIGYTNNASSLLKQGISLLDSNKIYHRLKQSYETAQEIINTEYVPTWSDELI